nr:hypothetical protein [Tanacetum cinerariifolium]
IFEMNNWKVAVKRRKHEY